MEAGWCVWWDLSKNPHRVGLGGQVREGVAGVG